MSDRRLLVSGAELSTRTGHTLWPDRPNRTVPRDSLANVEVRVA